MLTKTPRRAAPPASADAAAVDSNELQHKTSRRGRPKGTHKLDPLWYASLLQAAYLIELDYADGGNLYFRTAASVARGHRPKHVSNRQIAELLKRRKQYRHLTTGRLRQYLPGNRAAAPPALQHSTDRMSARKLVKFHIESSMWFLWFALSKTPDENQMISLASHMKNLRAGSVTVIVEECRFPTEFAERIVTNTARLVLLDLMKRFYAPFFPYEWGWLPGGRRIRSGRYFLIHPAKINFKLNMILRICDSLLETESAGEITNLIQMFDDILRGMTDT